MEDDDPQQQEQHSGGGFCSAEFPSGLTGDTAELDVRSGELARAASEGGREEGRGGGRRGGRVLRSECPGLARRPPTPPRGCRERAAVDRSIPAPQSAGPNILLLEQNKRYARRTSKSPREGRFFQSAKQRLQRASTHPGATGTAQLVEGGQISESKRSPGGVEVGARGRALGLFERPRDTSGVLGGRARGGEPGPQTPERSAFR